MKDKTQNEPTANEESVTIPATRVEEPKPEIPAVAPPQIINAEGVIDHIKSAVHSVLTRLDETDGKHDKRIDFITERVDHAIDGAVQRFESRLNDFMREIDTKLANFNKSKE